MWRVSCKEKCKALAFENGCEFRHGFTSVFIERGGKKLKNKSQRKRSVSYAKYGYFFAIPFLVGFFVFKIYPIFFSFALSFTDKRGFGSDVKNFVGLKNYIQIFKTPLFWQSFANTLIEWGVSGIIQVPLALLVVYWFTNKKLNIKGQGFWKIVFYMPQIICTAAIARLMATIFSAGGLFSQMMQSWGLIDRPVDMMAKSTFARLLISYIDLWRYWGGGMIIFLAAAKSVDPQLYDAAAIDGASPFQTFIRVTIPSIKFVLTFQLVSIFAGGLQLYDAPSMIGGGNKIRTTAMYIRNLAFAGEFRYDLATAASFVLFIIILAINLCVMKITKDEK